MKKNHYLTIFLSSLMLFIPIAVQAKSTLLKDNASFNKEPWVKIRKYEEKNVSFFSEEPDWNAYINSKLNIENATKRILQERYPDLVIREMNFIDGNRLTFNIRNQGRVKIATDKGKIWIFVDGHLAREIALNDLKDKSYKDVFTLSEMKQTMVVTDLKIKGEERRVAIVIDPEYSIPERLEENNFYTRTVRSVYDYTKLNGPDLIITSVNSQGFFGFDVELKNQGDEVFPEKQAELLLKTEGQLLNTKSILIPTIVPGGKAVFKNAFGQVSFKKIDIELRLNSADDETDNSNNFFKKNLIPLSVIKQKYDALTKKLEKEIIWTGNDGKEWSFSSWTDEQKNELWTALVNVSNGLPPNLTEPPRQVGLTGLKIVPFISEADAWKIYIGILAQSIWIEIDQAVNWSLLNYSKDNRTYLLQSKNLIGVIKQNVVPFNHQWNPLISYEFLKVLDLIKKTQEETLFSLAKWMQAHLIHYTTPTHNDDPIKYYGRNTYDPPTEISIYPLTKLTSEDTHLTAGCSGTTTLFKNLFGTINIPVIDLSTLSGHSGAAFPVLGIGLSHSDDLYSEILSGNIIPIELFFHRIDELKKYFAPESIRYVYCNENKECHSTALQAHYNHTKWDWTLATIFKTDGHLSRSLPSIDEYDNYIWTLGSSFESKPLKPLFTIQEFEKIVQDITDEIIRIGNGDFTKGEEILKERMKIYDELRL